MLAALRVALDGVASEIIIVDDSDDDTPALVARSAELMADSPRILLMHRATGAERAGGLATAVSLGMRSARARYVAVMDADLQHPPERLRALFDEAVATDADVVMATRYRGGGKSIGLDGISRHLISLSMKYLAKLVFPDQLMRVSDPLGGFFLVRRSLIEGVALRPIGYKISLELLVRCHWAHLVEVPYEFQPRAGGRSKSDIKQGMMVLRHMVRLVREVPAAARFWKFCFVGATGIILNLVLFHLLVNGLHTQLWEAWIAATETSILSNFVFNSLLTWSDVIAQRKRDWVARLATYHAAVSPNILLNLIVFTVLARRFGDMLIVDQAIGVLAATVLSYWLARRMVFVPRHHWQTAFPVPADTADSAKPVGDYSSPPPDPEDGEVTIPTEVLGSQA